MTDSTFRIIDHTADTGITVTAGTFKDLLQTAAEGFITLSFGDVYGKTGTAQTKQITENSFEDLLVEVLRELLLKIELEDVCINNIEIEEANQTSCSITIFTSPLEKSEIQTHIKGVTYHDIELKQIDEGYEITVIFDV